MINGKPEYIELGLRVANERIDACLREIRIRDRDYRYEKEARDQSHFNLLCFVVIMTLISLFLSGYSIYCIFSTFN